jgi:GDP-D-mannose dehydratase
MFSAEDAKEVFQLFAAEGDLNNPLILSSRGDGFVTRKYTRKAFEDLVTKGRPTCLDQDCS